MPTGQKVKAELHRMGEHDLADGKVGFALMKTIEEHFIDSMPADIAAMAIRNTSADLLDLKICKNACRCIATSVLVGRHRSRLRILGKRLFDDLKRWRFPEHANRATRERSGAAGLVA